MKLNRNLCLFFLCLCLINFNAFGQEGGDDDDEGTQTSLPKSITLDEGKSFAPAELSNCILPIHADFFVVNLEEVKSKDLTLFYAEITVRDQEGNWTSEIFPIDFDDFTLLDGQYGPQGELAYRAAKVFSFDMYTFYEEAEAEWDAPITTLDIHVRLLEWSGEDYVDFPICEHNAYGQLFSCEVFENVLCGNDVDCQNANSHTAQSYRLFEREQLSDCAPSWADTRTETVSKLQHTEVYPNPFKDQIQIVMSADFSEMALYNANGQLIQNWSSAVFPAKSPSVQWSTAHLPPGVYLLKIRRAHDIETIKLIKQ